MRNAGLMRSHERRSDLHGDIEHFIYLHMGSHHALAQGLALDELSGDKMTRIDLANLEDGQNVWVVQRRGRPRFLLKASHPLVVPGETSRQYLDRDFATQAHIFGQVNVTHSSGADVVENLVWPKRLANKRSSLQFCQRVGHQFESRGFNEVA